MSLTSRRGLIGKGDHDETPEYWITYSDLLVSLLVIFALLLFLALAQVQKEQAVARQGQAAVERVMRVIGTAMKTAASSLPGRGIGYDEQGRALDLQDEVLFGFGSATLRPEARELVRQVAVEFLPRLIRDSSVLGSIDAVVVEGHTDTVGTYLSNLDLSQRRAQSVMTELVTATYGLPEAHLLRGLLVASGRSEIEALKSGAQYDSRKARRIAIRVRIKDDALMRGWGGTPARLFGQN